MSESSKLPSLSRARSSQPEAPRCDEQLSCRAPPWCIVALVRPQGVISSITLSPKPAVFSIPHGRRCRDHAREYCAGVLAFSVRFVGQLCCLDRRPSSSGESEGRHASDWVHPTPPLQSSCKGCGISREPSLWRDYSNLCIENVAILSPTCVGNLSAWRLHRFDARTISMPEQPACLTLVAPRGIGGFADLDRWCAETKDASII